MQFELPTRKLVGLILLRVDCMMVFGVLEGGPILSIKRAGLILLRVDLRVGWMIVFWKEEIW